MTASTHSHDPAGGVYHRPGAEAMAVVVVPCLRIAVVWMRKKKRQNVKFTGIPCSQNVQIKQYVTGDDLATWLPEKLGFKSSHVKY